MPGKRQPPDYGLGVPRVAAGKPLCNFYNAWRTVIRVLANRGGGLRKPLASAARWRRGRCRFRQQPGTTRHVYRGERS